MAILTIHMAATGFTGRVDSRVTATGGDTSMGNEFINTTRAPRSALYSQAIRVGKTLYLSGMPGVDPATNQPAGPTIQQQTRQALLNCEAVLAEAGATRAEIVDVQVLLARPEDFAGLNEAYKEFFPVDPPARSVARLGPELPGLLVSIRMIAVL